jgi:hypothetical protein
MDLSLIGNKIIASTYGQGLYYTDNEGTDWKLYNDTFDLLFANSLVELGGVIYVGTNGNGVYKSVDDGRNWQTAGNDLFDVNITHIYSHDNKIYAANSFTIDVYDPASDSWSVLTNDIYGIGVNSMDFDGMNIYAATDEGVVISTDDGANWTKSPETIFGGKVNSIKKIGNMLFACTQGKGLFVSNNNGATWLERNEGLFNRMTRVAYPSNDYVLLGTEGYGLFRAPVSEFVGIESERSTSDELSVSPQPGTNSIVISNINTLDISVNVSIVDLNGQTISKQLKNVNGNSIVLDINELASGSYFLIIKDSHGKTTKKQFIKSK